MHAQAAQIVGALNYGADATVQVTSGRLDIGRLVNAHEHAIVVESPAWIRVGNDFIETDPVFYRIARRDVTVIATEPEEK